jgi:glycosyltransferase involved in cell wall biosynthesis
VRALRSASITWIGVVVPAHNEQELLPACIAGLRCASAIVDVPVHIVVVLDSCTDGSRAAAGPVCTLALKARNVGMARGAGFSWLLDQRPPGVLDHQTWLATTDADTIVPSDWLSKMATHARNGWDAVAGTVRVTDWTGHGAWVQAAWQSRYRNVDHHAHAHGANLGVRADAYRQVGGMPTLPLSEDAAFLAALESAGRPIFRAGDLPVVTSARRQARADGGFASYLHQLRTEPDAQRCVSSAVCGDGPRRP